MKPKFSLLLLAFIVPLLILVSATESSTVMGPSIAWAVSVQTPSALITPLPRGVVALPPACPTAVPGMPPTYCQKKVKVLKKIE